VQQVISLDPFSIENTEIFFGPGSVMYGSDAIGGVMSFQTLRPRLSINDEPYIKGNAVLRHASANKELAGHFDVNVGGKKWAMLTSISNHQYNDLRMGRFGPEEYLRPFYVQRIDDADILIQNQDPLVQNPSGYTQQNLMQKLLYKPSDNWEFNYGFHYSATSDYDRYDRHIRYDNAGMPRSAEWKYGPQVWMMNNLTVTHNKKNRFYDQMNLQLSHQLFEESRIDRNFNSNRRRIREEKVNAYAANLDFIKKISHSRKLNYGAEAVINHVNSRGIDEHIVTKEREAVGSRYPNSTWSSYGVYASYHQNLTEKLSFQAGARYNQFMIDAAFDTNFYPIPYTEAKINNGALTGSLGFIYSPDKTWALRLNTSSGFRAPNIDDMGKVFDIEPGAVIVPNPNLHAEYAYNGELGIAKIIGEYLKIDLTAYYTMLDNAMVRRDYQLNGFDSIMYDGNLSKVQAIQNAARANVMGVQADVELRLDNGFGVSSKINLQQGQEEMDDGSISPSRHVTPWFGVSRITYNVNKLRLDFYAMYSGGFSYNNLNIEERGKPEIYATDGNGNPYSPGWHTLNFKALYRVNENFQLSSGMENLTDQRYRPYSSGLVAPGRNFILALKMMF
jgi:hemoglobin/transferrin/lactoferrin receptor protein